MLFCWVSHAQVMTLNDPVFAAANSGGATLVNGLAAYWKLDEASGTAFRADVLGLHDLHPTGSLVAANPSLINNGVNFASSGAYLTNADDATLGMGSGVSFTLQAWIKFPDSHDSGYVGKWKNSDTSKQDYIIQIGPTFGYVEFSVYNLAGSRVDLVGNITPHVFSGWVQIIAGYDDSLQQTFMQLNNGVRIVANCVGVRRTAANFTVGEFDGGGSSTASGNLDEVGLWRRALTLAEVAKLYNGGSGNAYPFTGASSSSANVAVGPVPSQWFSNVVTLSQDKTAVYAPTDANIKLLDTFWKMIIGFGLDSKAIVVYPMVNGDIGSCAAPMLAPTFAFNFAGFNDASVSVNGLAGNGSTAWLDTGYDIANLPATDNSCAIYDYALGALNKVEYGTYAGGTANGIVANMNSAGINLNSYDGNIVAGNNIRAAEPGNGFFVSTRVSSTDFRVYYYTATNSIQQFSTNATVSFTGPFNSCRFPFYAESSGTGSRDSFFDGTLSFAWLGKGLTLTQSSNLWYSVQAYRTNVTGGYR